MAQCNNIYLDQNVNSANSANSLTYVPLIFFYGAVSYVYYKFISYIRQQEKEHDYAYTYQEDFGNLKTQFLQDESEQDDSEEDLVKSISSKLSDDSLESDLINQKQEIIANMLSLKTLERSLVLYYIFKIKGNFCTKTDQTYNSYKEYKKLESNFANEDLIDLTIGDKEFTITEGYLHFVAWLYFSGLYDYLTNSKINKLSILRQMNSENLLMGNLFLRYHLLEL